MTSEDANLLDPAIWKRVNRAPFRGLFRDADALSPMFHATVTDAIVACLAVRGNAVASAPARGSASAFAAEARRIEGLVAALSAHARRPLTDR